MKFAKSLTATAVLGVFMAGSAWAGADEPRKLRQLFGELDPNNPGYEVAVPFFKLTDANADGYPNSVAVSFKVYPQGSTTLLRTTPAKSFTTPAIPTGCTPNGSNYFEFNQDFRVARREDQVKYTGTAGSFVFSPGAHRAHLAFNMIIDCSDGTTNKYVQKAIVYSANLAGVAETGNPLPSWIKSYAGKQVEGLNGIDTGTYANGTKQNGKPDLINDTLAIVTAQEVSVGANLYVDYVKAGDGTAANTSTLYPFAR